MADKQYIILGPQGSGKGTQAQTLAGLLGIPQISTGDMFRQIAATDSDFGKELAGLLAAGTLVPDEVTNKLVADRLNQADTAGGFILDGYPRNLAQAQYLFELKPDLTAIYLALSDDEAVSRLAQRRSCPSCSKVYHLKYNPPKVGEVCDIDGAHLVQRTDDTEEAIRIRLQTFHQQTEPLLKFYDARGRLIEVDGSPPIAEVTANLRQRLGV